MKNFLLLGVIIMQFSLFGCSNTITENVRQTRITQSPNWNGETFQNQYVNPNPTFGDYFNMTWELLTGKSSQSKSVKQLPAEPLNLKEWDQKADLQFAWLGHTTFLYQVQGKLILTDPMLSDAAGPVDWISPGRYSTAPITATDLPPIDLILITHDHYDHLDKDTLKILASKAGHIIVPLGVGKHLEDWGIPTDKFTELDWWDVKNIQGLSITSTPAQHFSGRGLLDRNSTLWSGYAIKTESQNIFLSGDSGWHKGLYEIGEKLGPFDVTFFEIGAYGDYTGWKEIHFTPEEAVKAHQDVKGGIMVPSHWATFDLAYFAWHEPIERFILAAEKANIHYLTPKIGERLNPGHVGGHEKWWRPYMELKKQ